MQTGSILKTQTSLKNLKTQAPLKKKWRGKIPDELVFSPVGLILFFIALIFEAIDVIIPAGSLTLEIIFDFIFAIFLKFLAGVPIRSSILPFLIERIPLISDVLPTWIIKILGIF